jgi:hypothetical protein
LSDDYLNKKIFFQLSVTNGVFATLIVRCGSRITFTITNKDTYEKDEKALSLSLSLSAALMLALFTINACNPVDMTGPQHAELSEQKTSVSGSIGDELKIIADVSVKMQSRFMEMSLQERHDWVTRAEELLQVTNKQRERFDGVYRSDMDFADATAIETELNIMLASFDDLFEAFIPASLRDELTNAAVMIAQKRPDLSAMNETGLTYELIGELDRIRIQNALGGKTYPDSEIIVSDCEGLCGAVAGAAISATVIGYVSSMIKCGATGPGYGLCAGLATAYKSARLISTGVTLYACLNNCD